MVRRSSDQDEDNGSLWPPFDHFVIFSKYILQLMITIYPNPDSTYASTGKDIQNIFNNSVQSLETQLNLIWQKITGQAVYSSDYADIYGKDLATGSTSTVGTKLYMKALIEGNFSVFSTNGSLLITTYNALRTQVLALNSSTLVPIMNIDPNQNLTPTTLSQNTTYPRLGLFVLNGDNSLLRYDVPPAKYTGIIP